MGMPTAPAVGRAAASPTGVLVTRLQGLAGLRSIEPEWARLCERAALPPLYGPAWIRAHLETSERDARFHLVIARVHGRLAAVLPLVRDWAVYRGVPLRRLRAAVSGTCQRFDISADPEAWNAGVAGALVSHLGEWKAWTVLELRVVPDGARAWEVQAAAAAVGFLPARQGVMASPFLDPAMFEAGANLRHKLRRTRRRLEELGAVSFESIADPCPELLAEFFALEAAGWKGRGAGNAILRKGIRQRRFYERLAVLAAARGEFVLHRMLCDNRPVAISYGLRGAQAFYPLKWCYDEAFGKCSPGNLLIEEIVAQCRELGLRRFDFTGEDYPYKRDWTRQTLPHSFLFVFRPGRVGTLLRRLKFGVKPDGS